MKSTASIIVILVALVNQFVVAHEKVCSSFCSSLGMIQSNPGKSCNDIYKINKASRGVSGDYYIQTATGVHQVYCDMELGCGGHKGGWMRIANLDTTRGDDCPSGWTKITTNDTGQPSIDVCRSPSNSGGCYPTVFTVNGTIYHKICGKARGYQRYTTDGFGGIGSMPRNTKSINEAYVDGLSITLGNHCKHVWTYAVGFSDERSSLGNCPCAATPGQAAFPFIKDDYYCESGSPTTAYPSNTFLTSDPLWDGSGCIAANNNCCTNPDMPWFYRQFILPQKDDIEVRICTNQNFTDEAVAVDQLQLFVQ